MHQREFSDLVKRSWNEFLLGGLIGFKSKEKLKSFKITMRSCSKDTYGEVDSKIRGFKKITKALDVRSEEVGLTHEELSKRKESF